MKLKGETVGRTAKSYRQLGKKYQVDPKTVKKYLQGMNIQRKAKKSAPATTAIQLVTTRFRLRMLAQRYFAASSAYKCVMDDETYFTVEGNEWQPKYYYESPDHDALEKEKFIHKTKFPGKVILWLAISERGPSDPVFSKVVWRLMRKHTQTNVYLCFRNL